jgi:hypothetical protein
MPAEAMKSLTRANAGGCVFAIGWQDYADAIATPAFRLIAAPPIRSLQRDGI